jgi:hypothetical protein
MTPPCIPPLSGEEGGFPTGADGDDGSASFSLCSVQLGSGPGSGPGQALRRNDKSERRNLREGKET